MTGKILLLGHLADSISTDYSTADIYTHVDIGNQDAALEAFEKSLSDA